MRHPAVCEWSSCWEHLPDPLTELQSIGDRSAQEDDADMIRKHDENLLPHDPSLWDNRRV